MTRDSVHASTIGAKRDARIGLIDVLNHLVPQWTSEAICATIDPALFFPARGAAGNQAKVICAGCPVRRQCLAYALENSVPHGTFGGLSANERRRRLTDGAA